MYSYVAYFNVCSLSLQFTLFTTIHKHYSVDDWLEFATKHPECVKVLAVLIIT